MSDIFISYSHEDRSKVERLVNVLSTFGWSIWWDRTILAGKVFDEVIEKEIEAAKCIIVVWSRSSVSSKWVRKEARVGEERNILVPVLLDKVTIPFAFRDIQAEDLTDWGGSSEHEGFCNLIQAISHHVGTIREPLAVKKRRPSFRRASVFLLGAGVIILGILAAISVGLRKERNTYRVAIHSFYGAPLRFVTPEAKCGPRLFIRVMDSGSLTEEQIFTLEDLNFGRLQYDDPVRIERCGYYLRAEDGGGKRVLLDPLRDSATIFRIRRPLGMSAEVKEVQQVVFEVENGKNFITGANPLHAESDWIGNPDNIFAFIER